MTYPREATVSGYRIAVTLHHPKTARQQAKLRSGPWLNADAGIRGVPRTPRLGRFDEDRPIWFQALALHKFGAGGWRGAGNLYNGPMDLSERQRKYLRG